MLNIIVFNYLMDDVVMLENVFLLLLECGDELYLLILVLLVCQYIIVLFYVDIDEKNVGNIFENV